MAKLRKIKKRLRTVKKVKPEPVDLDISELKSALEKARKILDEDEYYKISLALDTLGFLGHELDKKKVSIQRLKQMLFGETTEKTDNVFKEEKEPPEGNDDKELKKPKKPTKGHGRNGVDSYAGAEKTKVRHPELKAGDSCPDCKKGTIYQHKSSQLIRISGQAPLQARVYELEKLRCNLCGKTFTAPAPEGVGKDKYDAESASMMALLKYGSGIPFNRLERLQVTWVSLCQSQPNGISFMVYPRSWTRFTGK